MAAGRWKEPSDVSRLAEITGAELPTNFSFYGSRAMIRETRGNIGLWKGGYGKIYGLASSRDKQAANPELLNVNLAVIIAGNLNEEVICLDYRENRGRPKVVCGTWTDSRGFCQWKVIAPTFDAFADFLQL
jgi:hypothetical protein